MSELSFQKELVYSARRLGWLSEITTDRFRKGRPDLMWKVSFKPIHTCVVNVQPIFTECKYVDLNSKGKGRVPVEATELQKVCLRSIRASGMLACITVFVTVDKKSPIVYCVYDIETEDFNHFDTKLPKFTPEGREKGKNIWPMTSITHQVLKDHQQNLSTEKFVSISSQ